MDQNKNLKFLKSDQIDQLRNKYGFNEIKVKKPNKLLIWGKNFWGPLPFMLEISAIVLFLVHDNLEVLLILFLLIINSIISFIQQTKTNKALEKLQEQLAVMVRVSRDGKWQEIPSRELLPGDLVRVRTGDIVTSDLIVVDGQVEADQSSLTGESMSISKTKGDDLFSGSLIVRGEAYANVQNIGSNTKYGQLTNLINKAHPPTNLEKIVFAIIKYQFIINIILVVIIGIFNFYLKLDFIDFVLVTIVLLLSAVPAAFPTMFIVSQTYGAFEMSGISKNKKGVLVRRLTAVQDAASMNVLCLDKTGTLTLNKPEVVAVNTYFNYSNQEVAKIAASASSDSDNDPIDLAFITYNQKINNSLYQQIDFSPFDIKTKSTQATIKIGSDKFSVTKGLPLSLEKIGFQVDKNYQQEIDDLTLKGYRVVAIGLSDNQKNKKIIGLLSMADPIRPDSKEMLDNLRQYGVETKIISGDNLKTARTIATQLGFQADHSITIADLKKDHRLVFKNEVFAEAFPEDKLIIIETLQNAGNVVGMTGDGVNDAPALSQAEVGIAVSNATDVAKNSASIVLSNNALNDIYSVVKISRQVDARIKIWAINKITKVLEMSLLVVVYLFIYKSLILTPLFVILIFFANDFVTISISTDNLNGSLKPSRWKIKQMVESGLIFNIFLFGYLLVATFIAKYGLHYNLDELKSFILLLLVFQGQASLYALRARGRFWQLKPSRILLLSTILVGIVLVLMAIFGIVIHALNLSGFIIILIVVVLSLITADYVKKILPVFK